MNDPANSVLTDAGTGRPSASKRFVVLTMKRSTFATSIIRKAVLET